MEISVHKSYVRVLKRNSTTGINTNINTSLIVRQFTDPGIPSFIYLR